MKAIIGKKIGMTGVFDTQSGKLISCTLIEAGPCQITQIRSIEKDGYEAIQVGYKDKKPKQSNKSEQGHFAKSNSTPKSYLKEFKNLEITQTLGAIITCDIFTEGEKIDVIGVSKGKGFQGVVKRHGFSGVGEASHGQHDRQRAPGSIGGSSYPARVFKGMRMAGRMGSDNIKIKGLKIIKIFKEKNYVLVSGAVPGYNGSIVIIQK